MLLKLRNKREGFRFMYDHCSFSPSHVKHSMVCAYTHCTYMYVRARVYACSLVHLNPNTHVHTLSHSLTLCHTQTRVRVRIDDLTKNFMIHIILTTCRFRRKIFGQYLQTQIFPKRKKKKKKYMKDCVIVDLADTKSSKATVIRKLDLDCHYRPNLFD